MSSILSKPLVMSSKAVRRTSIIPISNHATFFPNVFILCSVSSTAFYSINQMSRLLLFCNRLVVFFPCAEGGYTCKAPWRCCCLMMHVFAQRRFCFNERMLPRRASPAKYLGKKKVCRKFEWGRSRLDLQSNSRQIVVSARGHLLAKP